MRKFFVAVVVALLAVSSTAFAGGSQAGEGKAQYAVGMTVQDLSNQIWSSTCLALDALIKADGGTFTYLDCKSNITTQIAQMENFITNGVNAIIIEPMDDHALEPIMQEARRKGIKVFAWNGQLERAADICWIVDNYALGRTIGEEAAKWINEKHNGQAVVGVLNYPQLEILLERGNGIVDAIREKAPGARIVAQSSAINPTEGMAKTETFLQAYPDMKVIACIGGGGALGANEAVKSSGKLTPDFGIFAAGGRRFSGVCGP